MQQHVLPEKNILRISPNPIEEKAVISFLLPHTDEKSYRIKIVLKDILGVSLEVLEDRNYPPGFHEFNIQNNGKYSGIKFIELTIDEHQPKSKRYVEKIIYQ